MSNFGKSYSTKGNQVSRRSLIYVNLFGNYQAQKLSSFFYKYRQIPICSLLLERTLYPLTFSIQELNVVKYAQIFPTLYSCLQKEFPTSKPHCSAGLLFHCYEIVKMGYVLFISHALIRINVFGVR